MTRDRVRTQQDLPTDGLRLVPGCTITAINPLTVRLPAGTVVPGTAIAGLTYTSGTKAVVLLQPPIAPIVIPTN